MLCLDDYQWDDSRVLLHTLTRACKVTNDTICARLPVQIGLLEIILFECECLFNNQWYCEILYKTIFILAYYGMFRIGELAFSEHSVKAKDVHVARNKNKILLLLYTSKTHDEGSYPQEIRITANNQSKSLINKSKVAMQNNSKTRNFCPFVITRRYMSLRGGYDNDNEIFFIGSDGSPILPQQV